MKEGAKRFVKGMLPRAAIWKAVSASIRRPGVAVLMYHRITRPGEEWAGTTIDMFRAQMRWLRDRCDPIEPDAVMDAASRRRGRVPVLVTFDDGYKDFHDQAYPVLHELRIPSLVFLATGAIDEGSMIWTDQVEWAVAHAPRVEVRVPWTAEARRLDTPAARHAFAAECKGYLKGVAQAERLASLELLFDALGCSPQRDLPRQMLDWPEIRATMELTRFGGHTHTHPILSQMSREAAESEIETCKARITAETGTAPHHFAYPNGRARDFTPETIELLRKHGFRFAYSTIEGLHGALGDPMAIRRQYTTSETLGDFALRVAGR